MPTPFRRYALPHETHNVFGISLKSTLAEVLHINTQNIVVGVRYDIDGVAEADITMAEQAVLGEAPVSDVYTPEAFAKQAKGGHVILIEPVSGQYDQRADFAAQCLQIALGGDKPTVTSADVYIIEGNLTDTEKEAIATYLLNPVDSQFSSMDAPLLETAPANQTSAAVVDSGQEVITDFTGLSKEALKELLKNEGLTMPIEDIIEIQKYFTKLGTNPRRVELLILDMYWSDHCRHTTFLTELTNIKLGETNVLKDGEMMDATFENATERAVYATLQDYMKSRDAIGRTKPVTMMDLATSCGREMKFHGAIDDLEQSEEINAASVHVPVTFADGRTEDWLFMFKNETHNHPTEISPEGGASTALGGCIRDPLSGRSYVFMGVRFIGSADPREDVRDTLKGKLSQRQINQQAAHGFAGYGNQIGVPTMMNYAVFHEGYEAKRFCCGAVGAATPAHEVRRESPVVGDVIIAVGGATGRDGIGGATGSSKEMDEESVATGGAEVQKGNPPEERALQRLFRNPAAKKLIKKCNDFGAGGLTNAVGEMADGVHIRLETMPLKYAGLTPTEIALSESQERMAVLVEAKDVAEFIRLSEKENLFAVECAVVTDAAELLITHHETEICRLDRALMDGGWAERTQHVQMNVSGKTSVHPKTMTWSENLAQLATCSRRGVQQMFDTSVGANSVHQPFGGATQSSPSAGALMKFPVPGATTTVGMTAGFDPHLSAVSPFIGGAYAVVESVSALISQGIALPTIRLTLQNYFPKLEQTDARWGMPLMSQLGAYAAQKALNTPAIGGKDSMSGTYTDRNTGQQIDVPPTLVSFAIGYTNADHTIPAHFQTIQSEGEVIGYFPCPKTESGLPKWDQLISNWKEVTHGITNKNITAARPVAVGGLAAAISQMAFGNSIGATLTADADWFNADFGGIVFTAKKLPEGAIELGRTTNKKAIMAEGQTYPLDALHTAWEQPLESVFPLIKALPVKNIDRTMYTARTEHRVAQNGAPRVFLPIFLGTNCEYETAAAFEAVGGTTHIMPFQNKTEAAMQQSLATMAKELEQSQILMLSGGFSAGDQPGGAGKFIANVLRSPQVEAALQQFLARGGMMLGVCNGFQALMKSGLLPTGTIGLQDKTDATLGWNTCGHFISTSCGHSVTSVMSPWMRHFAAGEEWNIPIAHGEGRFCADAQTLDQLWANGQVALRYTENYNGSAEDIAGISSPDGRIFGLMGHPERAIPGLRKNTPFGNEGLKLFKGGVDSFLS